MLAGGDAELGQPLAGAEHGVEVHQRLAHAHEDRVVDGLLAAEVQRLVEDLRGGEVAAEAHRARWRRRCRSAGSPTGSTGRASGARRGSASARPRPGGRRAVSNSAFSVPSEASASSLRRERRERHLGGRAPRAARARGWSSPRRSRRPWPPTPTPGGRGTAARRARRAALSSSSRSTRASVAACGRAPREVPRPRRSGLAARGRGARARRAA